MNSITTTVTLIVSLILPDQHPIWLEQPVDDLTECWDMARQLTERAEEGPLRLSGGKFIASCRVEAKPSEEH